MAEMFDFSTPRRQPAKAVVQALIKGVTSVVKMMWPVALAFLFSRKQGATDRGEKAILISVLVVLIMLTYNLIEFFYLRYMLRNNELIIKKGFFVKREVVLPLEKIQAVHIDRDWLQRLMNIAKVSFDTPGTTKTEERFFLDYKVAVALRESIMGEHASNTVNNLETEKEVPVITLNGSDLFKLGISANFVKALAVMAAFAISRLDDLQSITGKSSVDWIEWLGDEAATSSVMLIASAMLSLLILSIFGSFVLVVMKYGNFSLTQTTRGFHIRSGLINIREKLVPFKKIQFVSWHANWIRRYIPYYLFNFHILGDHEISDKWRISVPVTRLSFFPILLQAYHPELSKETPSLHMQRAYVYRQMLFAFLITALLVAVSLYAEWGISRWFLLVFPVWVMRAILHRKNFSAAIAGEALQINHDIFSKAHHLIRWDKIVSVKIKQSIYQRRHKLASVVLYTGGGKVTLPYITLEEANKVRDYALYKSETA